MAWQKFEHGWRLAPVTEPATSLLVLLHGVGSNAQDLVPLGQVLAGPCYDGEGILTADVDLSEVAEGKYDLDTTGHYARPDIFRLEVNERPAAAVDFKSS